jgi:prepilin signal peptidase PulO-like enzyme (type II secretory pathway)
MSDLFWVLYRTIVAGLFGLLIGSFLNVCIYRLPRGETIAKGRSYCPHCRHELAGADLIPVFSYLLLHKRCRYCSQPIAPRYARIESVTGIYFALAVWLWGSGPLSPALDGRPSMLQTWPAPVYNAAVLFCILLAFCSLLVWAMILFDRKTPPRAIYWFIALPVLARLALQPDRLLLHLAAALFAAAFWWLLHILNLIREEDRLRRYHMTAGFLLLGLVSGLFVIQPVMAILLTMTMLQVLWLDKKMGRPEQDRQLMNAPQPVSVLVGFVFLLFL